MKSFFRWLALLACVGASFQLSAKETPADATLGYRLTAEWRLRQLRLETAFGETKLPVALVKNLRVSLVSKLGRPRDGLIGLWSAEGNAKNSVTGREGVLRNVSFAEGVAGMAFSFSPERFGWSGVLIPDEPAFALTKSVSVEAWIRPRGNSYIIFFRGDHRPGLDPYCLSLDGNMNLTFGICAGDNEQNVAVKTPVGLGAWIHAAGVLDDATGTLSLFTNGLLAAQTKTNIRPFGPLLTEESPGIGIGNLNDGGNNFPFNGEIDEVGVYNRALSAAEVNAIYLENAANAGELAPPAGPRSSFPIRFGSRSAPRFDAGPGMK